MAALLALAALAAGATAAVPQPGGSYPDDRWLAVHFRPHLLFDSKERWRPLDVDAFLAEPGHQACPPGDAPVCAPLTDPAHQLTPAVDHLDLRGDGPDDAGGPSAIYAHVTRRGRRVAIDYWWFLRYNAYAIDRHEGDWEGVTVIADLLGRGVRDVHFAAHTSVWRYPPRVVQLDGRHVRVYVARGGHASYPRPCRRYCRQTDGTAPDARSNGRLPWAGNTTGGCRAGRCVELLPDPAAGGWAGWDGRWGVTESAAFAAPLTPAFQARYRHPFAARGTDRDFF